MPSDRDYEFARIAVERKRLAPGQAEVLLADLRAAESLGAGDSFPQLAQKRGLLSEADCRQIGERVEQSLRERAEIGGFKIIEKIGRGGMGAVFKARQISMDRVVALKILSRRLAGNRTYVRRFVREARAAAKLDHPNIVQGINVGNSGGYYYFAMEYVDGETLAQKLKREGRLAELEAAVVCAQIARALDHAYSRANIIHRDVKPQNILLSSSGPAKLADLGLAREAIQGDAAVTFTGVTLGTPDYISPEQIRGEVNLDGRCDVYSLGATLFHLLAGRPPYQGETANVTMAKHLTDPVPDVAAERPDVSADTAAIVRKAMQKEKTGRYQTAGEMAAALDDVRRKLTSPVPVAAVPRPEQPPRPRRRARPAGSVVGVVLLLIGLALAVALIYFIVQQMQEEDLLDEYVMDDDDTEIVSTPKAPPDQGDRRDDEDRTAHHEPDEVWAEIEPEPDLPKEPDPAELTAGAEALRQAQDRVLKLKNEPWLLLPELERIIAACHSPDHKQEVRLLLDAAARNLPIKADARLAELDERARGLCDGAKFAEALAALEEFPNDPRLRGWRGKVDEARKRVRDRAAGAFADLDRAAAAAADAGKFDDAVAGMKPALRWGLTDLAAAAQKRIDDCLARKAVADLRGKTEQLRAAVARRVEIFSALQKRDYAKADRLAAEAARRDDLGAPARQEFTLLQRDIQVLASLWDEAERRLRDLRPGDDVRLGSIKRRFVSFRGGVVTAKVADMVKSLPLRSMGRVDLFDLLAPYFGAKSPEPGPYLQRGLFCTFEVKQDLVQARKDFDKARQLGAADAAARGQSYIEQFAKLRPEQAALLLLTEAREAAAARRWPDVTRKLDELAKHRKTQAYQAGCGEMTRLMLLAAGRGRGLAHLFSGQTALRGADAVTITYDLRQANDRRDWRGGTPVGRGLRCDRELRWNAGVNIDSVKLVFRMPQKVDRAELRILCSPQGDRPLVTAGFGVFGGRRCYLFGRQHRYANAAVRAQEDTTVAVVLAGAEATFGIAGKEALRVPVGDRHPDRQSIFLSAERQPVDVARVTVAGTLDLDWARRRAADLADIAESTLLGTFAVPADKEWSGTGLTLAPGTYYHLRARGWWTYGRIPSQGCSAAGEPRSVNGVPIFSLVAKAGEVLHYVGEEAIIGPHVSGGLALGMNELRNGHAGNSGKMTVEVRKLGRSGPKVAPGLLGRYYTGINFDRLKKTKVVPNIDFDLRDLGRVVGQGHNFSVRWEGLVKIARPDLYQFAVFSDDGSRLWLDGKKVLDEWRHGVRNMGRSRSSRLAAGLHKIRIEYFQAAGGARIKLYWRRGAFSGRGEVIPPNVLFHPAR